MLEAVKFSPVSPTQKLVLLALADCHNGTTGRCDPSVAYLERVTGLAERTIQRALAQLESAGLLMCERRPGTSTAYRIEAEPPSHLRHCDTPEAVPPPSGCHPTPEPVSPHPRQADTPPPSPCHPNRNEPERTGTEPEGRARPRPEEWRREARKEGEEANAEPIPTTFPMTFRLPWAEWCGYRMRRAAEARTRSECLPWTAQAARLTLQSCERHAGRLGWDAVIDRLHNAITGHWQSLNLDKAGPPPCSSAAAEPKRRDAGDLNPPDRYK